MYKQLPLLLTPVATSRVSKTTFGFDNSVEGLTEFIESCCAHSYGLLLLKDTDLNKPSDKAPRAESRNCSVWSSWLSFPHGVRYSFAFPILMFSNTHRALPARDAYMSFGVQSLYQVQSCKPGQVLLWLIYSPVPREVELIPYDSNAPTEISLLVRPKASTLNHVITLWLAQCLQLNKDTFIRHNIQRI